MASLWCLHVNQWLSLLSLAMGDEKTLPIQLHRFFVSDLHVHLQHLHLVHLAELEILAKSQSVSVSKC